MLITGVLILPSMELLNHEIKVYVWGKTICSVPVFLKQSSPPSLFTFPFQEVKYN